MGKIWFHGVRIDHEPEFVMERDLNKDNYHDWLNEFETVLCDWSKRILGVQIESIKDIPDDRGGTGAVQTLFERVPFRPVGLLERPAALVGCFGVFTMKTRERMVFSRSAAGRIVQALPHHVEVQVWSQVIWVKVKGRKPKFISPKAFIEDFHQTRMRHAKNLDYRAISDTRFVVINPENGHKYLVDLHPDKLTCTCEDYAQQSQVFEQSCCKHCYRILFALGYQNLVEYVEQSTVNYGVL